MLPKPVLARQTVSLLFGLRLLLFAVVGLPGLVDYVGVDSVGLFGSHLGVGEGELWRIGEAGHSFVPVGAGEDDGVPLFVHFGRGVAEIGDGAVQPPGAAAVDVGGAAAGADEHSVDW